MVFQARIIEVEKTGDTYNAKLEVVVDGRQRVIELTRLARKPSNLSVKKVEDNLVINLYDEEGRGYASCIIYLPNLEKKECKSLIVPH